MVVYCLIGRQNMSRIEKNDAACFCAGGFRRGFHARLDFSSVGKH